jgi:hypothetical protein
MSHRWSVWVNPSTIEVQLAVQLVQRAVAFE